jgi:tetratricopeptide (TPR) repeat protein
MDVLPTLVSLARAGRGGATPAFRSDGVDLAPFLAGNESPRLEAYSESYLPLHQFNWSPLRALRTERLKYIEAPEPELYDLSQDPLESRNVFPEQRGVAAPLQATLAALERHTGATAHRPESDPLLAERFMSLGYIGYSPALPIDPSGRPDPKRKLQVYELAMSAFELAGRNRPDDAVKALRRAEALDSNVTQVHYLMGTILGQQGRYGEAAVALEQAVRLNPRYLTAQFKLALAYLRLERPDKAERALQVVLDNEPQNVRAMHNMAAIAYSRGDLTRAERLEREAVATDPKYFDAWNTLGAIYVLTKRPDQAIEALRTALQLDPRSGQAHHNLALALRATGQHDAASETARTACALDPRFCT